jgi:hypothetical protein
VFQWRLLSLLRYTLYVFANRINLPNASELYLAFDWASRSSRKVSGFRVNPATQQPCGQCVFQTDAYNLQALRFNPKIATAVKLLQPLRQTAMPKSFLPWLGAAKAVKL